jgi:hypothetical protein
MAARLNARHDDEARKKIQTSQLINRLTANAMGEIEMTAPQVQSAKILLDKSLPNLANVTVGGDSENPLSMTVEHTFKSGI